MDGTPFIYAKIKIILHDIIPDGFMYIMLGNYFCGCFSRKRISLFNVYYPMENIWS